VPEEVEKEILTKRKSVTDLQDRLKEIVYYNTKRKMNFGYSSLVLSKDEWKKRKE
jgi:hypothetical protein